MKENLRELVTKEPDRVRSWNLGREYLQARILGILQDQGAMIPLAFHGGTCLRFLYAIPRFSEDLDFALDRPGSGYDFRGYLEAIRQRLKHEGYAVEMKISDKKTVHGAFIRFPGLPFEIGLSPHRTQTLSIKMEIDTRPPAGAGLETTLVRRHVTLQIQHHDKASLLAGKLHAILMRPYTKGRDLYDLLWYLSDRTWPEPNLDLLNHALDQTGWNQGPIAAGDWRGFVRDRLQETDFRRARMDLAPFIESEHDLGLVTRENLIGLLTHP